jgi:hypothetical protein
MSWIKRGVLFLAAWTLLGLGPVGGAEPLPPRDFQRLHDLVVPATGESKWTQVPWLTSLWEARRRAAAEGKPILLWEMDGHPLGCT